ncbi:MAG: VOC family protein [Saprospiraceae bacterium]|nr:VOC family protein [Saprospiraceae bacterium]
MHQQIAQISLLVRDYDEAIDFYVNTLGFQLKEDTQLSPEKRWVVVGPNSGEGCNLLLEKAANEEQSKYIGRQTGGRVFLFLNTDDFDRDYENYTNKGVKFIRPPEVMEYGKVSVFEDLYGNLWDLIGRETGK